MLELDYGCRLDSRVLANNAPRLDFAQVAPASAKMPLQLQLPLQVQLPCPCHWWSWFMHNLSFFLVQLFDFYNQCVFASYPQLNKLTLLIMVNKASQCEGNGAALMQGIIFMTSTESERWICYIVSKTWMPEHVNEIIWTINSSCPLLIQAVGISSKTSWCSLFIYTTHGHYFCRSDHALTNSVIIYRANRH